MAWLKDLIDAIKDFNKVAVKKANLRDTLIEEITGNIDLLKGVGRLEYTDEQIAQIVSRTNITGVNDFLGLHPKFQKVICNNTVSPSLRGTISAKKLDGKKLADVLRSTRRMRNSLMNAGLKKHKDVDTRILNLIKYYKIAVRLLRKAK